MFVEGWWCWGSYCLFISHLSPLLEGWRPWEMWISLVKVDELQISLNDSWFIH